MTDEVFVDTSPTGPSAAETDAPGQPGQATTTIPTEENKEKKEAPYTLIVRAQFTFLAALTPVAAHIFHTQGITTKLLKTTFSMSAYCFAACAANNEIKPKHCLLFSFFSFSQGTICEPGLGLLSWWNN